eukprot:ctg_5364.g539
MSCGRGTSLDHLGAPRTGQNMEESRAPTELVQQGVSVPQPVHIHAINRLQVGHFHDRGLAAD